MCKNLLTVWNRCIQSVNYKEGGVAKGDQPAIAGVGGNGYGYEASEVPEVERKEFLTKVWTITC